MSDDDRALARVRTGNTPIAGVPVHAPEEDDFTPVASVFERIEESFVPTERERMLLHLVWQHTANMELRSRARRDTDGTKALVDRVDGVETAIVDIRGERGNNGKLGALKARVDALMSRAWWLVTVLVGGVGAAAVKLIIVGRAYGELETEVQANKARIQLLERVVFLKSRPAAPEKESP